MQSTFKLNSHDKAILLDVLSIFMTLDSNENTALQKVCDTLFSALPINLVWGGLIDDDRNLTVSAAAGNSAPLVNGIIMDCNDVLDSKPMHSLDNSLPTSINMALLNLNKRIVSYLPTESCSEILKLFPLILDGHCIGILGFDGTKQAISNHQALLQLSSQHTSFALGMFRNFAAKEHVQKKMKLAAAVFDHSLEGIFITDANGTILAANDAVTRFTGYTHKELIGQNPRIFKSGRHDQEFYSTLWASVRQNNQWEGEIWNKRKNDEIFPEWLSISAIRDEYNQIQNYICIFIDISKQKEAEGRLKYLAYHDKLTGLPNRDLFHDRLNAAIMRAKRGHTLLAVLFIDIDHFKFINDTFGHANGDLLLQKAAIKVKACLREVDTLARMGGDEFTVILEDFTSAEEGELTARRILKAFDKSVFLDKQELYVSVSIGISFFPQDATDPSMLMKHADTALYSAKNNGRKCLHFFRSNMGNYSIQRIEMERQLRRAVDNEEFVLFYQPQFSLSSGRMVGAEALIRWQHPQKGLIMPGDFIPLAEDTGMIVPIGEWVLRQACAECQLWHQSHHALRIGVNLSAHQFNNTHLNKLVAVTLDNTHLDSRFLELELTESVAMLQVEETLTALKILKKSGIQLTIDDFGTGYSSLSYLKQFPIDRLKIDRSFINDIANDPNDAAIVVAIISMAHCLGLEVIAEGVETGEQLKFLRLHGCNEVQGYLLGRPIPDNEFWILLDKLKQGMSIIEME